MELDRIDHAILAALQENARIPNAQLADKVGLSPSACSRRLDALEQAGAIRGYHARLSNRVLGHPVTVIVHMSLASQSERHLAEFEEAVKACPNVQMCYLMSGEHDYILRVVARDLEDFERIHKTWLSAMPHVVRMNSSFALRNVVDRAGRGLNTDLIRGQTRGV
ncbi:MAG: Lrp/AsnC family transcriptional regulator [Rhizobiaceae bacterium]|nr:Lrp/AsnC family transcriptional regulator [Rhizobiaceae bacterium]